jgi:glycosyltransferase involved in cell wall biosynthesis
LKKNNSVKKTICHITINHLDYERRIKNQAESATTNGDMVWIIALGKKGEKREEKTEYYRLWRIKTPFEQGGPLKFLHFNLKVLTFLLFKKITVIHCHDLWVLPAAAMLSWVKFKFLIYDAHEYYAGLELFVRKKIRKKIWLFVEKIALRRVSVIITVSRQLADLYVERYPRIRNVEVIRNLPRREQVKSLVDLKRPVDTTDKIVVYQGHFRPGRGLENLIRAFQHVSEAHLLLIGGGELTEKLHSLVQGLSLKHRVTFYGYVPTDELIRTTAAADLGIVLFEPTSINYAYALPNKFFEYVMAGIPVLASDIKTFSEYIDRYQFGRTVDPSNITAISNKMNAMLHDEQGLLKWRDNAVLAARELNWENEAVKLESVYRKTE